MLDRKTFLVPVMCPACKRLATLAYTPAADPQQTGKSIRWDCPFPECKGQGTFYLHGELISVGQGLPSFFGPNRPH